MLQRDFVGVVPRSCGSCTEILAAWVEMAGLWGCLRLWWLAMHWLGLVAAFSALEQKGCFLLGL